MKKSVAILLVVIVLVTGVPLVMAGPVLCTDCDAAAMASTCTFGVLLTAGLAWALLMALLRRDRVAIVPLFFAFALERPPRLA